MLRSCRTWERHGRPFRSSRKLGTGQLCMFHELFICHILILAWPHALFIQHVSYGLSATFAERGRGEGEGEGEGEGGRGREGGRERGHK